MFNFSSARLTAKSRSRLKREFNATHKKTRKAGKNCASSNPYQCVEVVTASNVIDSRQLCQSYHDQQGKRYLSAHAPSIPLKGCDKSCCGCKYKHYGDRRVEERRSAFGSHNRMVGKGGG